MPEHPTNPMKPMKPTNLFILHPTEQSNALPGTGGFETREQDFRDVPRDVSIAEFRLTTGTHETYPLLMSVADGEVAGVYGMGNGRNIFAGVTARFPARHG